MTPGKRIAITAGTVLVVGIGAFAARDMILRACSTR